MTFQKIKSGIPPLDNQFQGLYLNRPTLLSGKRRSGTSTLALRFLSHVLQIGEKLLLFTEESPDHVTLEAHGLGTDISEAIHNEQLDIVPYDRHLPLLPFPEALDELRGMISDRHYSFVVFDPVMPWLAAPANQLESRLNAFFGLLDDTGATSFLILRHPVSALARRLTDEISERCAICLNATQTAAGPRALEVTKYMGAPPEKCPTVLQLAPAASDAAPYLSSRQEGMSLRELHKTTQRIQANVPSYLPQSPRSSASRPAASRPAAPRPPAQPSDDPLPSAFPAPSASRSAPRAADRRDAESPLPSLGLPHAPSDSRPSRAPAATPPPPPPSRTAPPVAPVPSPFHSHEPKSITQIISMAHLLDDPDFTPRRAAPRGPAPATAPRGPAPAPRSAPPRGGIRFADAQPAASRPPEAPAAPAPSAVPSAPPPPPPPPPEPPPPAAPEHPIRFSDVIQ